jgi:ribosome-associated protein
VNSRVELRFAIQTSNYIGETEKNLLLSKLKTRINAEGEMVLFSQSERSQLRNKELVTLRFFELLEKALTPVKKRKKTKPTKASKLKRLKGKKQLSEKKEMRKRPEL